MTFIPAWAESALTKASAHDVAAITLLREFYECWEALMAIPQDKVFKHKRETAAGVLREKAMALRAMKKHG